MRNLEFLMPGKGNGADPRERFELKRNNTKKLNTKSTDDAVNQGRTGNSKSDGNAIKHRGSKNPQRQTRVSRKD